MKKYNVNGASDLGMLLGLTDTEIIEAKIKTEMMKKIKKSVQQLKLTHQQVADKAGVGRTVITGIVNCSIQRITIDRLLKVLISLGVQPVIKYKQVHSLQTVYL